MSERSLKPGWQVWRFDQMATSVNDRINDPSKADVEYYVGLEHLDSDSLKIRRWGTPSDVEATKLCFRKGDIIFGRRRVYQRKVAVADFDGICSAHALVLRAKPANVDPGFLPFFMQSDLFMERAKAISVGSLSPTINWKTLAKEEFALPPLEEQKEVIKLLAEADKTVSSYQDFLKTTIMLQSSIRAASFNPHRYSSHPLADFCNGGSGIQIGPFGSQLHQSDYTTAGIPVVMPANMQDEKIDVTRIARVSIQKAQTLAGHQLKADDILLPRRGELDRRAYVKIDNEGWLCGTGSIRIRVDKTISPRTVFHALSSVHSVKWLKGNAVGTTMPNLNSKIISTIPIALPPNEILSEVICLLDTLEEKIQLVDKRLKEMYHLKSCLLSKVLK